MARPPDPTAKISLLRAAEEEFAAQGLAAAKVESISRRAGLSKGAFYLHFESKDAAFKQVVESFLARLAAFLTSPRETEDVPTRPDEIVAFWHERDAQIFEFLWQNRALIAIVGGCQGQAQYAYLFDAFSSAVKGGSREWLDHFKAQKMLRADVDTELVATLMFGAYHELSMKMLASPRKPPIDDWLRQTLTMFLLGLATRELADAAKRPTRSSVRPRARA
jgi:AcrR family transcriptional regulator